MIHLSALLLSSPAWAADVSEWVSERKRFDRSLAGTTQYALFLQDLNLGRATIEVRRASRKEQGTYHVTSRIEMNIGPQSWIADEIAVLDEHFSLVSSSQHKVEISPQGNTETLTRIIHDGAGLWTFSKSGKDGYEASFEHQGANYTDMSSQLLLARSLEGSPPQTWTFPVLKWKVRQGVPDLQMHQLIVGPVETIDHWGAQIEATPVAFPDTKQGTIYVGQGAVLAIEPTDAPFVMRACMEAQCTDDLVPDNPEEASIKEVFVTLFGVFFGLEPVDKLDEIVDWSTVYNDIISQQGTLSDVEGVEEFRTVFKSQLAETTATLGEPPIPIRVMVGAMIISIDGDTATVELIDNTASAIRLEKREDGWKLLDLPNTRQ